MSEFDDLMAAAVGPEHRFGHRQHVRLTWLTVRRHGTERAIELISDGIRQTTRYVGKPQKYHATVSRAWVELVGHHAVNDEATDFDVFAARNPALLDKRLLTRFYRSSTLAGAAARTGWVAPDLAPFPWHH
ncbi:MAG TPA: hypothetical protein VGJ45_07740 [Pseudonocardiaceae bacterium]|jgi:hypothetical protein